MARQKRSIVMFEKTETQADAQSPEALHQVLRDYFRAMASQLQALGQATAANQRTLLGTHREIAAQLYLKNVLPAKFSFSTGEVRSSTSPSNQVDVIIHDALDFPILSQLGSNTIFIEAVRCSMEIKSRYSRDSFIEACNNGYSVTNLATRVPIDNSSLLARMRIAETRIEALEGKLRHANTPPSSFALKPYPPCTAVMIYEGGHSLKANSPVGFLQGTEDQECLPGLDSHWPTLAIMLNPGIVYYKRLLDFSSQPCKGTIEYFKAGRDAILLFTALLLRELGTRAEVPQPDFLWNEARPILGTIQKQTLRSPFIWQHQPPLMSLAYSWS